MEVYVKKLYDRLSPELQGQLFAIMDQAINELMDSGGDLAVPPEEREPIHDPDPQVRIDAKTTMAKRLGRRYIVTSRPAAGKEGIAHIISLSYDPGLTNCLTLCIQGGLEGLYSSGVYLRNPTKTMEYHVLIDENYCDPAPLLANLRLLGDMYPEFRIVPVLVSQLKKEGAAPAATPPTPEPEKKKKGLFGRLFGKK